MSGIPDSLIAAILYTAGRKIGAGFNDPCANAIDNTIKYFEEDKKIVIIREHLAAMLEEGIGKKEIREFKEGDKFIDVERLALEFAIFEDLYLPDESKKLEVCAELFSYFNRALTRELLKDEQTWKETLFNMESIHHKLSEAGQERILEAINRIAMKKDVEAGKRATPKDFLLSNIWDKPTVTNPGTLLNARYVIVPFLREAREQELDDLNEWCNDKVPTAVRLFFGPGGTGKTRLFIEYCRQLRDKGWYAGFLPDQTSPEQLEALLNADKPTLAVLDYAECRPQLFDMLKHIVERPEEQKTLLRLVLLARDVADWWQSLLERDESVRHLLMQSEPILVAPIPLKGPLRQQVWEHAQKAFADYMGKPSSDMSVDLEDERYGRILYLHIAALASVEGLPVHADSLIEDIVKHECHFWIERYKEQFHDDDLDEVDFRRRCARLVAALTLLGGTPTRKSTESLNQCVDGPSQKHIIPFLRSLYPGRREDSDRCYLGSLEPDILGETLVRNVLTDANNSPEQVYLEHVFEHAQEAALLNGFVTLGRISLSHTTESIPWLTCVLHENIPQRARQAFQAALTLGRYSAHSPLGQILANTMEKDGTVDLASEFESLVPEQTVSLRELVFWATKHLLTWLGEKEQTEENLIKQARLLNNLGTRLSELGRREDALKAAQEAVDIYRRLAKDRPDAFLPYLAGSLNNLGIMLSELGRREEALKAEQEAVEIRRRLAKDRPDGSCQVK